MKLETEERIKNLTEKNYLVRENGFLFRRNKYENSVVLTGEDFENNLLKNHVVNDLVKFAIKDIEVNDIFDVEIQNTDFLSQIPWIESIKIIVGTHVDKTGLLNLSKLKKLICNYSDLPIEISAFEHLVEADLLWNSKQNVGNCVSLKSLTLHKFKSENLILLRPLKNLTSLKLIVSNFKDVEGIEHLKCLESLEIYSNSKITELDGLTVLSKLKKLWLIKIPKLTSLEFLKKMSLEFISVENCKNIVDKV
jgi:hypothetical protein